jgi:glycosyltransferase involved in cell wall biosynthesis
LKGTASFGVISHVSGELTPAHHLVRVLNRWKLPVTLLSLPFHHGRVSGALMESYREGGLKEVRRGPARPSSIWSQLPRDLATNLLFFWRGERLDCLVALDNLNAFAAILLRRLGRTRRVVYYVIDHTPDRFDNGLLNRAYAWVDRFCCRHADHVWVLSSRMEKAKLERGARAASLVRTPIGVEASHLGKGAARPRPHSLVVVSYLAKSKGIQLVLEAMPEVLKKVPKATLTIFGTGPYEDELKAQASRLKLGKHVIFAGFVKSHADLLKRLGGFQVGVAPYAEEKGNYSFWADPAKPKEYLACGLPVVITKVPEIAETIDCAPMGLAVEYDRDALAQACIRLLTNRTFYSLCRRNALAAAKKWDWETIFGDSFRAMKFPWRPLSLSEPSVRA